MNTGFQLDPILQTLLIKANIIMFSSPSNPQRYRVGLLVPSSNITLETELPALLRRQEIRTHHRFTLHSQRLGLTKVDHSGLLEMNRQALPAGRLLAHADIHALIYGCLIAAIAEGPGSHRRIEAALSSSLEAHGCRAPVLSSAGALIESLHAQRARKIAIIAPYHPSLTQKLEEYFSFEGIEVRASRSLNITDNLRVGLRDPSLLLDELRTLPSSIDALVISACVQMPSLEAISSAEATLGIPVLSALTATTHGLLNALGQSPHIEGAGSLLQKKNGYDQRSYAARAS